MRELVIQISGRTVENLGRDPASTEASAALGWWNHSQEPMWEGKVPSSIASKTPVTI
jgi:hypothetical protein